MRAEGAREEEEEKQQQQLDSALETSFTYFGNHDPILVIVREVAEGSSGASEHTIGLQGEEEERKLRERWGEEK